MRPAAEANMALTLTSSSFRHGGEIPSKYTCEGADMSPPLSWSGAPAGTGSYALIVDDPDAPRGTFNHWLLFNMDPAIKDIKEDCVPVMATQGRNDFGEVEYGGPKPPSVEHSYFFKAYVLDTVLPLSLGSTRDALDSPRPSPEARQERDGGEPRKKNDRQYDCFDGTRGKESGSQGEEEDGHGLQEA